MSTASTWQHQRPDEVLQLQQQQVQQQRCKQLEIRGRNKYGMVNIVNSCRGQRGRQGDGCSHTSSSNFNHSGVNSCRSNLSSGCRSIHDQQLLEKKPQPQQWIQPRNMPTDDIVQTGPWEALLWQCKQREIMERNMVTGQHHQQEEGPVTTPQQQLHLQQQQPQPTPRAAGKGQIHLAQETQFEAKGGAERPISNSITAKKSELV
jgi:hypothetical protein